MHKKFILKQNLDLASLDYKKMENHVQTLNIIDKLDRHFHWMFDYSKNCFYYLTENTLVFPKREFAFTEGMGYQSLIDNIHPEDVLYLLKIQKEAFSFYFKQPVGERLKFKYCFKVRILVGDGEYLPYNFNVTAIATDTRNGIFMSLAEGYPSKTEKLFKPLIISTSGNNRVFIPKISHPGLPFADPSLTCQEVKIIRLISKHKGTEQICSILNISPNTFNSHRKNIFKKLNAANKIEAIENAGLLGLLGDK